MALLSGHPAQAKQKSCYPQNLDEALYSAIQSISQHLFANGVWTRYCLRPTRLNEADHLAHLAQLAQPAQQKNRVLG